MSLLKPVLPYIAGAAILVGGVWLIDYRAYNRGVEDEATRWQERVQEEYVRQLEANREALRVAQEEIERLRQQKETLDAEVDRLEAAAAADVEAGRTALPARSVRRLNAIR
jgi:ubiquinone biosynthesis protein UbiJ